jgi:hypothetical protein
MIANGARETSYVWIVVNILDTIIRKYSLLYIALLQAEDALAHGFFFKFTSRICFFLFLCTLAAL